MLVRVQVGWCLATAALMAVGCKKTAEPSRLEPAVVVSEPLPVAVPTPVADAPPTVEEVPVAPPENAPSEPYSWAKETIGELRLGMTAQEVRAALGEPETRSAPEMSHATGEYEASWEYPREGVFLVLTHETRSARSAAKVSILRVVAPSTRKTSRGIGVGTPFDAALAAYQHVNDPDQEEGLVTEDGDVVVGSVYGGLILQIEDGRVQQIFIGAAGE